MIERDAVASFRRRAAPRDGISRGGLLTAQNTQQATTDSTLNSPVRALKIGGSRSLRSYELTSRGETTAFCQRNG